MARFKRASGLIVLLGLLGACGGGGGGGGGAAPPPPPPVTYSAKSGVAQKGPLIKGSTVTTQELDASLSPTGKQYSYQITSDLGTFSPMSTFGSQYIGLNATGYYFDEVKNAISTGTITLNGYSDLGVESVLNVNLLTTLAYQRIQHLVTASGMTFVAARTQAENEVLAALNVPTGNYGSFGTLDLIGGTDGDHILAAVSSIFTYGNASGPLSALIANFQNDIGANGVITSAATKAALVKASESVNPAAVAGNLTGEYSALGVTFTAANLSDWIDRNGIGIVGRFTFQVANASSASSFTFPSYVATQFAGTPVAVTAGQLSVNGIVATAPVMISATDVLAVSPSTAAFQQGILIVYLTSGGKNVAAVIFLSGGPSLALVANNANTGPGTISVYTVAPITGVLTPVVGSPFTAGLQPFSVTVNPGGSFAYIANGNSNNISAFSIDPTTGALAPIVGSPFAAGTEPISFAITPSGNFAYAANWGGGTVSGYSIDATTGALTPLAGSPFAIANAYFITVGPSGKFAYATDNFSSVSGYSIDPTTGALAAITGSPFAAGTNPWSVTVNSSGTFAYVPNAGSGNVSGFSIDPTTGALTPIPGSPFLIGTNFGPASVAISPDGTFAYVANEGANSISAFSINTSTGALTPIAGSPFAAGTEPTSVTVDPTGKFLYATNTRDNAVSAFSIDPTTGALSSVVSSPFAAGPYPESIVVTQLP